MRWTEINTIFGGWTHKCKHKRFLLKFTCFFSVFAIIFLTFRIFSNIREEISQIRTLTSYNGNGDKSLADVHNFDEISGPGPYTH